MIKRYHEAPLSIFEEVQSMTDGDYALVHLIDSNIQYRRVFKQAIKAGRDVILDNSIFELGTAFDMEKYTFWIKTLNPTWYIVPDSWKNSDETCAMFEQFITKYPNLPGKRIGVAQGNTPIDTAKSYKYLEPYCDMIAFNLDFSSYWYTIHSEDYKKNTPYCEAMSKGRHKILNDLYWQNVIKADKPHHLLGCGVPQEVSWYKWPWIRSIDTSNPVVHGLKQIKYRGREGLQEKEPTKLCDLVEEIPDIFQREAIWYNLEQFKRMCG